LRTQAKPGLRVGLGEQDRGRPGAKASADEDVGIDNNALYVAHKTESITLAAAAGAKSARVYADRASGHSPAGQGSAGADPDDMPKRLFCHGNPA